MRVGANGCMRCMQGERMQGALLAKLRLAVADNQGMKKRNTFWLLALAATVAFAQEAQPDAPQPQVRGITENPDMQIQGSDIVVHERLAEGERVGVDLYVRKKPVIQSVMLVETTKDPEGREDNYAYRAGEWNEVNGDEIRYLNGQPLTSPTARFSLISSTVTTEESLGECFHIYIPNTIYFGYPWTRNGSVVIGKGVFINIRTFEMPYGDYTGSFMDNPFMFDLAPRKAPPPPPPESEPESVEIVLTDDYNPVAALKFGELADEGGGLLFHSNLEQLTGDLIASVEKIEPKSKVDLVLAVDTTGSMKNDMRVLREKWIPLFIEQTKKFDDLRIGLLFYRDYNDNYKYKKLPVKFYDFTSDPSKVAKELGSVVIKGNEGGDIPEAVYEALYAAINFYAWREDAQRKIILLGDAEPHPEPRGDKKISQDDVVKQAKKKGIVLDCIIVPDEKPRR